MIQLNDEQFKILSDFLNCDPTIYGKWAIIPNHLLKRYRDLGYTYIINEFGTHVIRLASVGYEGKSCHTHQYSIGYELDKKHQLCSIGRVHRLVFMAFDTDNWDDSLTVNHIDGDPSNNHISNLEMLTSSDNCKHYQNSEVFAKQRIKDFKHHGDTIRGRIHITDGVHSRMIYESDGIPEGWWKGRPQSMKEACSKKLQGRAAYNKGKILINNGTDVKYIPNTDNIPYGWKLGGTSHMSEEFKKLLSSKMSNKIFIYKDGNVRRVDPDECKIFLKYGWCKGLRPPVYKKKYKAKTRNKSWNQTEEAKRKISKANKGRHHTEEAKQKMRHAMKGREPYNKGFIWITDGETNKMISESDLPNYPTYRRGITRPKIKRVFVNNGMVNHKVPISDLEAWLSKGYVKGLVKPVC